MTNPIGYIEELHNLPVYNHPTINIQIISIYDIFYCIFNNFCHHQASKYIFFLGVVLGQYSSDLITIENKESIFYYKSTVINALKSLYDGKNSYYDIIKNKIRKIYKCNGYIIEELGEDNDNMS